MDRSNFETYKLESSGYSIQVIIKCLLGSISVCERWVSGWGVWLVRENPSTSLAKDKRWEKMEQKEESKEGYNLRRNGS